MNFEKFLKYYQGELSFLLEAGKDFSSKYPNIAKTLDFSSFGSDDPHVQRIIESVAFLNAKLQQRLDEQIPEISSELLNAIFPQFISPIPSCSIMHMQIHPSFAASLVGKKIPRGSKIFSQDSYEEQHYTFTTCMDLEIPPWSIKEIEVIKTSYLDLPNQINNICENSIKISLEQIGKEKKCSAFKFHIHMQEHQANILYEAIMGVFPQEDTPVFENGKKIGKIVPVGFNESEALLPFPKRGDSAYRLLLEYNAFCRKFFFFEVILEKEIEKEIIIPLNTKNEIILEKNSLLTNCTPAVNLFEKTSEPIDFNYRTNSYRIIPDHRSQANIEIHTVKKIEDTNQETQKKYVPYFSCQHVLDQRYKDNVFWTAKREYTKQKIDQGTDIFISFKDSEIENFEETTLYAKLLCMQRNAAKHIPSGGLWRIENSPGGIICKNLERPTTWRMPPMHSESQWRLISHLSINYFGFENKEESVKNLKELLGIYDFANSPYNNHTASCIQELSYEFKMSRSDKGVIPKACIEINVDNEKPSGIFLLSSIIGRFLADSLGFNTKIEVSIRKTGSEEIWKKWNLI